MVYNFLVWVWSTIGTTFYCLVLPQVPKCFVLDQIFWTRPKIELHIVPSKIFCAFTKTEFTRIKSSFGLAQNVCLGLAQYINYILSWNKKIDSPQNSFGPVEGQGINWKMSPSEHSLCTLELKVGRDSHSHAPIMAQCSLVMGPLVMELCNTWVCVERLWRGYNKTKQCSWPSFRPQPKSFKVSYFY